MNSVLSLVPLPRALLYFEGADLKKFLQGILTNDVKKASFTEAFPAFYLNPKGKWIASFQFLFISETVALALCSELEAQAFLSSAQNLLLFSQTKVEDVSANYSFYFLNCPFNFQGVISPSNALVFKVHPNIQFWAVPKKNGETNLHTNSQFQILNNSELENLRIELGIPLFGKDIGPQDFPNMSGLEHYISYDKGCYVGQETIARIKNYGRLKEALAQFELTLPSPLGADELFLVREGQKIGKLHSLSNVLAKPQFAIGRIQLDALENVKQIEVYNFPSISCRFLKLLSPPCSL